MYGTDHAIYKRSGKFYIYPGHLSLVLMKAWPSSSECISSAIKVGIGFIALTTTIKLMLENATGSHRISRSNRFLASVPSMLVAQRLQ